jgi:hypothetical protein
LDDAGEFPGASGIQLAMAAAVAPATVKPAATSAMEAIAAVKASVVTATVEAAMISIAAMPVVAAVSVVAAAIIAATVEAMTIVAAVEPRAGTDEDAADEVVRAVVSVRSAGVRIIAVVAVGANWRGADGSVHGTYRNADANLCVSAARGKKQNSQ